MPINHLTHFVLVDFENVPSVDLSILENHPLCVSLFLGRKSKLKSRLVEQITQLPFEVRLIKIGQIKKNAVDFVLTFHLGEMVSRYPRGHFYIISEDQDYEPLVTHLQEHQIHISQHKDIASLPFVAAGKPESPLQVVPSNNTALPARPPAPTNKLSAIEAKPSEDRRAMIFARLKDPENPNRSATLKGLHAYIKNALGKQTSPAKVDGMIADLRKSKVISSDAKGKITYH